MNPVMVILVPGVLGGLALAALYLAWQRRHPSAPPLTAAPYRGQPLSTDAINMSSIKVAGVGGLGLVAMAAAVALDVPRIGETVAIGFVLGSIAAVMMILRRRRTGPMPSSGRGLGANTVLSIDAPRGSREAPDDRITPHDVLIVHVA
jgi:hypothetical protein